MSKLKSLTVASAIPISTSPFRVGGDGLSLPGHEIVGRVVAVGDQVEKYAPGDLVGVGCIVDSCKHCEECEDGLENYCDHMTGTYNSPTPDEPGHTLGGYSQQIVVHERYVLRIRHPQEQLAAVAPLLCAGITTYSPLRHWQAGPGKKWAWSASAVWDIWGLNWPTRWGACGGIYHF